MKLLLGILSAVTVLAGCATSAPPTEPGTGDGLQYVPMVSTQGVEAARYESDVAECRTAATRVATRSESNYDAMWYATYVGLVTWYSQGLATGWAVGAIGVSGVDFSGQPTAEALAGHQKIAIVHCMSARGYRNMDPNVRDTFTDNAFTPPPAMAFRRTGVDTYNVEKLAKASRCNLQPRAVLTAKGPGYEAYNVPCDSGSTWAVRCEFGNCRVVAAQAALRRAS